MLGKYIQLERHLIGLNVSDGTLTLSIQELESVLGFPLPPSAHRHAAWWSNTPSHSQSVAWMAAGYQVECFRLGDWVKFRKQGVGLSVRYSRNAEQEIEVAEVKKAQQPMRTVDVERIPSTCPQIGTLALVSCVKTKRHVPSAARDLYTSAWFRKAKAYVEELAIPWCILSAEYGLVYPDTVLVPYERTLKEMSAQDRRAWANQVTDQIMSMDPPVQKCVVLAGQAYREYLLPNLNRVGVMVEVPLYGLTQGRQLSWLGAR